MQSPRLVVVSNRVPVEQNALSPGGLVSALRSVLRERDAVLWCGWSGQTSDDRRPTERAVAGTDLLTIDLSEREVSEYYEQFCNRILWPAFHGMQHLIPAGILEDRAHTVRAYRDVNARLAEALAPRLREDDLVWVHDYHLIPLGAELRARGFQGRIGYFHHIPVHPEGWKAIPNHEEFAASFVAYDLVGVQTDDDADALYEILPEVRARIGVFPASVDPEEARLLASSGKAALPHECGSVGSDPPLLFVGAERLDYTKAIPQRLDAFRQALGQRPDMRRASYFVQAAAPSRETIPEYQVERSLVERAAAQLLSDYPGTLCLDREGVSRSDLLATLAVADVCVVNSVADGMNLVAKEFAAVQTDESPGVLIVSDGCGAAHELHDAIIVPSEDSEALADAMIAAFDMPIEERRRRARGLRAAVERYTAADWASSYLVALVGVGQPSVATARRAEELVERTEERLRSLQRDRTVERLWERDHELWSPDPSEIVDRLGWLDVDRTMRDRLPRIDAFARCVREAGFTHALVAGMGGSAMAPRVFRAEGATTDGLQLEVLDSIAPDAVTDALARVDPERTLYVISSKSGTTVETLHLLEYLWDRTPDGSRFIAITDAGSRLQRIAEERSFRAVFLNPPDIGGRYSALSLYGLVPAALAGVDLVAVLEGAEAMQRLCSSDALQNPGARLGAALAEAALMGHDLVALEGDRRSRPFAAWIEQLVAESTGKDGKGLLPVVGRPAAQDAGTLLTPDLVNGSYLEALTEYRGSSDDPRSLGAEFFRWEFGVAVAASVLELNPFDQPNVEETKAATQAYLDGVTHTGPSVDVHDLLSTHQEGDQYFAIHAYLGGSPEEDEALQGIRDRIAAQTQMPTVLEYGPSFLHSTGQYHKAGARSGLFLQVLPEEPGFPGVCEADHALGELLLAEAEGDRAALERRGRAVAQATLRELRDVIS